MFARNFRYPDAVWPNSLAIGYALLGYPTGIGLLLADHWLINAAGTLLVAHTLIISAYLLHEFAHTAVFKTGQANARWGSVMTWINGSCYARFADLRHKHMRHHVDRADVITFDSKAFLQTRPAWLRKLVLALEWAYIPAVELIMHGFVIVLPFVAKERRRDRARMLAVLLIRLGAFALLGYLSLKALVLYAVAYFIMLTVLRFTDAFQHTYDAFALLSTAPIPQDKLRDNAYEQVNTYSNVFSLKHPWLDAALLLNFAYHNAHHEKPAWPWHRLPKLHNDLCASGTAAAQVIPMRALLAAYHKHRVTRVLADDYGEVAATGDRAANYIGAYGVSFLTAV